MATQLFNPAFTQRVKRARELNAREAKDIYHHPTEDGIVRRSIDLASPKPMSEIGSAAKSPSEERWLEAYLIREAKKNNWMLQFGEKQYRAMYSQGKQNRSSLHYEPCGGSQYRALYSDDGRGQSRIRYSPCGSGRYRALYSENGEMRGGICYAPSAERRYRAVYSENGGGQSALRYFQCGQKQYRLLTSQLRFGKGNGLQGMHGKVLDLLLYDEDAKNLVILEVTSKRELKRAVQELDAYNRMIRRSKAGLKKAFDLDEIGGVVSYVVWPASTNRGNGSRSSHDLGEYGLIEYTRIPRPWEAFRKSRERGEDLRVKFNCRRTARRVPLR